MKYENGDTDILDIKNLEPVDDYQKMVVGSCAICKTKVGRFSAVVLEVSIYYVICTSLNV